MKHSITIPKGAVWFPKASRPGTKTGFGIFYIESIGVFLTPYLDFLLPVNVIFKDCLKKGSTLSVSGASINDEEQLMEIKSEEKGLDWAIILAEFNYQTQEELLTNGFFFPFEEQENSLWVKENDYIIIDLLALLNSMEGYCTGLRKEDDCQKAFADLMFCNGFDPHRRITIMGPKEKSLDRFEEKGTLSNGGFLDKFLPLVA
jgi:hypothetical protein